MTATNGSLQKQERNVTCSKPLRHRTLIQLNAAVPPVVTQTHAGYHQRCELATQPFCHWAPLLKGFSLTLAKSKLSVPLFKSAHTAMANPQPACFNSRYLFPPRTGGWKSRVKGPAGLAPLGWLVAVSSLCPPTALPVCSPSLPVRAPTRLDQGPAFMPCFELQQLPEGPTSKSRCIRRCQGLRLQHNLARNSLWPAGLHPGLWSPTHLQLTLALYKVEVNRKIPEG